MAKFAPKNATSGHVNISGEGEPLPAGAQVSFGVLPATSVEYMNPRLIRAGVPPDQPNGVVTLKLNDESLGGFTFGPPLTGLQLQDAFAPAAGGTLELLGNGFRESGRTDSPQILFRGRPYTGATKDNSLMIVEGIPSGQPDTSYALTVTFSDGATATSTVTYV